MASPSNSEILELLFCMAPQFYTEDPDVLECYNTIIDALRCQVNAGVVKCCTILAYVYLLAHALTIRTNPQFGVASSMSEGDLSISFAISASTEYLELTPWGKAYSDLIKRTVFAPTVSNLPSNFNPLALYGSCGC